MNKRRVVITGVGAVTPLGLNAEEFWAGLSAGKSGIGYISYFDTSNYQVKVDAEINGFDPAKYMDLKIVDRTPRSVHLAITAAQEAMEMAGLDMSKEMAERVGVITSTMIENDYIIKGFENIKKRGPRRGDPLFITKISPAVVSSQIGLLIGAKGPNSSVNSLCASGADAIGNAMNHIRLGYADVLISGGSDASLEATAIAGLNLLGALTRDPDPAKACRPFDLNRSGFVYGEGAGIVILESYEHAKKRGAPILAELAGVGWSFDAYDATAPQAETQAVAINNALEDAGLHPEEIDYINAHGTSTRLNDSCETKAIKIVFGDNAYRIPVSSNKSMFGHIIAGAGAVEAVAAVLTINNGVIPPTINYETPDPECDLDYVPNVARQAEVNACLSNSFGLGGNNCCLVIKRFNEK
ncbi:MAG: beta-ketoacyl-[acyl-carrier-protein] synthase II [Dehalococcoidales bacterium]|nr:beta-ketoacyl-[acyl-carrier-protein] synthase II [Dehalococcoidales bacterium]|tara:strand:- start:2452 stop:3687 length:1236 start_codon:yes stop_codon:yes gene_type:complete